MNVEHLFVEEHDHPKATFPFHDSRERTSNLTCGYRLSNIQSLVNICKHHLGPNPKVLMLSSLPLVCPSIESRRSVNGFSHLCFEELLPKIFSLRHPLGDDLGPRGRDEKECLAIFGGSKGHSTSMNCHDGLSKGLTWTSDTAKCEGVCFRLNKDSCSMAMVIPCDSLSPPARNSASRPS